MPRVSEGVSESMRPDRLADIGLFGCLGQEALALIAGRAKRLEVSAGECLFEQGTRGREMYVILDGGVDLRKRRGDHETTLVRLDAGQWCGEMSLIDVQARPYSAYASEDGSVLSLDNRDLDALYRSDLKSYALFVMNLARQLSRKLRDCEERFVDRG